MKSRSKAKPVVLSSGTPKMLALDHESCAAGGPVGTESGTLETMTFQVADDVVTPSTSHRRCAAPSIVLPGPSGSRFELRYWRGARAKTTGRPPHRDRPGRPPRSSARGAT